MKPALVAVLMAMLVVLPAYGQTRTASSDLLADAHYRTAWELFAHEAWDQAAREFQAAIDINPEFKLAYYGLGRSSMGQKDYGHAIKAYERCRDLYASQASRNFANKAEADRMMQDDTMQIDTAIQRLSSGPQSPQVAAQIAQLRMQKQRFQSRMRGTESLSIASAVPSFVSLALGSAYFRSGRFADAEREYKATVEADPKAGEAHNNLAVVYLLTNRYDDAEKAVKAAEKAGYTVNPQLKDDIKKKKTEKPS